MCIRDSVTTDVLNQYRDELTAEFCGDLETAAQRVDLGEFVDIEETFYKDLPPYAFGNDE